MYLEKGKNGGSIKTCGVHNQAFVCHLCVIKFTKNKIDLILVDVFKVDYNIKYISCTWSLDIRICDKATQLDFQTIMRSRNKILKQTSC